MSTRTDPWESACLEQIEASLGEHAEFLARHGKRGVTVQLEDERPSTRLLIDWYDERSNSPRFLGIPLWEDFADMPPEEVERSVVLTLIEA